MEKSEAYKTFLASMNIGVDEWRDGIGFNLEALQNVTESERDELVETLSGRLISNPDWREVEALAAIGTPPAKSAIRNVLEHADAATQLYAAEKLAELGEAANLEEAIIKALRTTTAMEGLAKVLDMAEQYPSPRIQETLLGMALNGDHYQRVYCAAPALYLGGKAKEAFDWDHRAFFLKFGEDDRAVQLEAYNELCRRLGVRVDYPSQS